MTIIITGLIPIILILQMVALLCPDLLRVHSILPPLRYLNYPHLRIFSIPIAIAISIVLVLINLIILRIRAATVIRVLIAIIVIILLGYLRPIYPVFLLRVDSLCIAIVQPLLSAIVIIISVIFLISDPLPYPLHSLL